MSCGVGHRCSLDPAWLWCRPSALALIRPLAWELPYAAGAALKNKKKTKTKTKKPLLYDSAIPFLGTYPDKTFIEKDTGTPMFTATLFTIAMEDMETI